MSAIPPAYPSRTPPGYPPAYPILGVDADGLVQNELPCRKCGYTVRGLSINGRCPECGTPVGLSVQGDLLRYSEPRWVRTLQRGVVLILCGIGVLILAVIAGVALAGMRAGGASILVAVQGLSFVGSLLMVVGAWLLTEPDPSGIGEDRYGTARKIIRVALIVGLANSVLEFVQHATTFSPDVRRILVVLASLAALVGLVGQFAQLSYLSKLATRIPDPALVARARFLMWAIGVSYGLMLLGGLVFGVIAFAGGGGAGGPGGAGGAFIGLGCVMGIVGIALVVFSIMYLLMLDKFRLRLREQAAAAEASWARVDANAPPAT